MDIELPSRVRKIISTLEDQGYEAFAVGGCVRDVCLGKKPSDWDITTSAPPLKVKEMFSHTVDTGLKHGTVTVVMGHENFEVTTYRIDGAYEDMRHPKEVTFTTSLSEDLKRRDFTINAMAYNERQGIIDLFGGREDLEHHLIRCVGEPEERFHEDALRIFRAVRFSAQLDFSIDGDTAEAIRKLAPELGQISPERIRTELEKLITSDHPERLRTAWKLGVTAQILPEFDAIMTQVQNNAHHVYTVGEHTLRTMQNIPPESILRFTMLFHDFGKPAVQTVDEEGIYHYKNHARASEKIAVSIMKRLKFDNASMNTIRRLIAIHSLYPEETEEGVRRAVHKMGEDLFPAYLKVKRADILGQSPAVQSAKLAYLGRVEDLYATILKRRDCMSLKEMKVTGDDLKKAGISAGPGMGRILNTLLDDVLSVPEHNERGYLMHRAEELAGSALYKAAGES